MLCCSDNPIGGSGNLTFESQDEICCNSNEVIFELGDLTCSSTSLLCSPGDSICGSGDPA